MKYTTHKPLVHALRLFVETSQNVYIGGPSPCDGLYWSFRVRCAFVVTSFVWNRSVYKTFCAGSDF